MEENSHFQDEINEIIKKKFEAIENEANRLNSLPSEMPYHKPPLYTDFVNYIRMFTDSVDKYETPEKTKQRLLDSAHVDFVKDRTPACTIFTIDKLIDMYWHWNLHTYTIPEEKECVTYWKEFRQFARKNGVPLRNFDKITKRLINADAKDLQKFFVGCYVIAEDRASSLQVNSCYQVIVNKVFCVLHNAVRSISPDQFEETLENLGRDSTDMDRKLFDILFDNDRDTVGKISAIVQIMIYMDNDPAWIPYMLDVQGQENITMLQHLIDVLLQMILGKDKLPVE
jgi:hypothetical protein